MPQQLSGRAVTAFASHVGVCDEMQIGFGLDIAGLRSRVRQSMGQGCAEGCCLLTQHVAV